MPLEGLKLFQPIHLALKIPNQSKAGFYLSISLEKPILSSVDSICYVTLKWATFHPLPPRVKRFNIALCTDTTQTSLQDPYMHIDPSQASDIEKVIQTHQSQN